MGSTLSIVNNTEDKWHCRLSPDTSALKFAKVVFAAIATAAASTGDVASEQSGSTWATISDGAKIVSQVSVGADIAADFAGNIIKGVEDHLLIKGYSAIEPGQKHTWGPMSLSLWQQGTCIRSYAIDNTTVRTETLYMRPIFSGSTANSNRDHDIKWWINKWGVEHTDVVEQSAGSRALEGVPVAELN